MKAATMAKLKSASSQYREERDLPDTGCVVWHKGIICGWSSTTTPEGWLPGCIGVWETGEVGVATGGDMQAGAVEWVRVESEVAA